MCFLEFGGFQSISLGTMKKQIKRPTFVDSESIYFYSVKALIWFWHRLFGRLSYSANNYQICYIYIKKFFKRYKRKKYEDLESALALSWEFLFSLMNLRQTQYTYLLFLSLKAIQFLVLWEIYEKFYEKFKGHMSVIKNFSTIKRYKVKKNLPYHSKDTSQR